jgi:AraC family transcriptional regulator of adaptative response/methylated-DNA-[protein]-cysteine methyltransferase
MKSSDQQNFERITQAINFIGSNFRSQPTLDEVAASVHLSPYHFQRLFSDWAGVSPKKFLQYISIEHAKAMLREPRVTLFDAACETGLSGTGRLHDLFVNIEGMTPGEYKNGGAELRITFSCYNSPFGKVGIASTERGICFMAFTESETEAKADLQTHFPNAGIMIGETEFHKRALRFFTESETGPLPLHIKGTDFQLKVWEALLKIPMGRLYSYGTLAQKLNTPKASRAVGSAIGKNPIAYLIPCHRVIQSGGLLGGYRWGTTRKAAMIGWEAARVLDVWSASITPAMIRILKIKILNNRKIHFLFSDHSEKTIDFNSFIKDGDLSSALTDASFFAKVQLYENGRGIFWPNDYDFCPDFLRQYQGEGVVV